MRTNCEHAYLACFEWKQGSVSNWEYVTWKESEAGYMKICIADIPRSFQRSDSGEPISWVSCKSELEHRAGCLIERADTIRPSILIIGASPCGGSHSEFPCCLWECNYS